MSTYPRSIVVNFGPAHTGIAGSLTYSVKSPDGLTTHIATTGTGIFEVSAGTGAYAAQITGDTLWGSSLLVWLGPGGLTSPQSIDFADVTHESSGGSWVIQASFDPSLPTKKDEVRARVGDVTSDPQWYLDDRTITAYLAKYTFSETCARCAEDIGGICIQQATVIQQRNLKLQYEGRARQYYELAERIRNDADPEPDEPKRHGAMSAQMVGPDLSNYVPLLGLPRGDPNAGSY